MLLSGTALAGYEVLNSRYAGNVEQENLLGDAGVVTEPGEELTGSLNLLLLGVEERGEGARSDTIIVLHIPSSHDQAYLISVPRDTWVTVPGYWDMKITEAFNAGSENGGGRAGGARLVASVLHALTGLSFDGAAIVNFDGFQRIIDQLGGIRFCVDTAATSEHLVLVNGAPMGVGQAKREGHWDAQPIRYEEGCQELAGWQALDYARQRKTLASGEGDYGRQRHQQQLLTAMADAAISRDVLTNLGKLDSLVLAGGDALVVDTNGVPLADFVFTLRDIRVGDLVSLRTNGGDYHSAQIEGVSAEALSPESLEMFRAAANDTMAQFVINHPDFTNRE
jgi:LCP family protein required for cell wall assembly